MNENAGINSLLVKGGLSTKALANAITTKQAEKEVENAAAKGGEVRQKTTILPCVFFRRGFISTRQWSSNNHATAVTTRA